MRKIRRVSVLNLSSLMIQLLLYIIIHFKMINAKSVHEVFAQTDSLLTPAGITFSIYGFIATALIAFCVYHMILAYRHAPDHPANNDLHHLGYWFIINNIAAAGWLIAWTHAYIGASVLLIFFQLISLIVVNLRTGLYDTGRSIGSKIFTQFPLSIYTGWIAMITMANAAVYLSVSNWNGFGLSATDWSKIMISMAVLITLVVIVTRGNISYGLVILWVLYGIILRLEGIGARHYADVIQTAWIGMAVISFTSVIQLFRNVLSYGPESTRFLDVSPVNNSQY